MEQTIELDCPAGPTRPGDLIEKVLEGTGLPVKEPVGMFFGHWTWDYSDVSPEVWKQAKERTGPRITSLYNKGIIRYGSW